MAQNKIVKCSAESHQAQHKFTKFVTSETIKKSVYLFTLKY